MDSDTKRTLKRFGRYLRELRESRGLTQDDLAERCNLSQRFISQIEQGTKTPSFESMVALAHRGFGLRMARMLDHVDVEVPDKSTGINANLTDVPAPFADAISRAVVLLADAARRR